MMIKNYFWNINESLPKPTVDHPLIDVVDILLLSAISDMTREDTKMIILMNKIEIKKLYSEEFVKVIQEK